MYFFFHRAVTQAASQGGKKISKTARKEKEKNRPLVGSSFLIYICLILDF